MYYDAGICQYEICVKTVTFEKEKIVNGERAPASPPLSLTVADSNLPVTLILTNHKFTRTIRFSSKK